METIGKLAMKSAAAYPDKTAVKDAQRSFTYREMMERALALTAYFKKVGLKKGDRFGILMSNRLEHIELDVAAALSGVIKVPLNYRLHPKEHAYMLMDADVKLVIGEEQLIEPIDMKLQALPIGEAYEKAIESCKGIHSAAAVDEDDIFAIMYTSGTTGNPKGVMLSHRNMIAGALSLALVCETGYDDVIGHVAPLTHGSNFLSHVAWLYGLTQVVFSNFEPEEFVLDLKRENITVIFLVPTMVNLMIQHPKFDPKNLSTLKAINMAGSAIAASKLEQALALTGPIFAQTFGQVEAPMCITMMPKRELGDHLESCGRVGPFVDVKIVDDQGTELPAGEVGEIVCKGSLVMKGYWNNEQATNDTLIDGWLQTGDLGWKSDEGYVHIVDRKKDVIISGGVNIYPREVEEVLNKHTGVKETCVIGVPDDKWGENVIAYVVPNGTAEVTNEDLIQLCLDHMASFKKPKEIHIVEELPKSSYGKILKRELRSQHEEVQS
ncbi:MULTISPECIES: class I adenylate-forming enzyme family protein [unclassified Sporosarcina]|uniref:class I adenylate-forming enzyme family protein n=1 Tax=unclassified Sporosarcina TaxID=2647733 RepID=UPI002041EC50|nr:MULTISPECIES: AMP-binding protein [unclassified Sporosarcina]GKV63923.1 AMP-dependent synthetase [Sporosarcina sp. NCCP-2331]GLB54703.1 AMP-dependent synthetase [Sporosarcina sp. NCCP-2378]